MIFIVFALITLCVMAFGGAIIILEVLVAAGEADPSESAVRYVLSAQPAWVTISVAIVVGATLIALSAFMLRRLINSTL